MKKQIITTLAITTLVASKSFAQWGVGTMNTPIQTTNGYVGIGTASPLAKLTIWDANNTSDETQMIRLGYSSSFDYRIFRQKSDGVLRFDGNQATYSGYRFSTTAAANALSIANNGNIGIGIAVPGAKLEVTGQVKITGGTPGAGKVLTSDAAGLASWTNLTGSPTGGTTNYLPKWTAANALSATSLIYDNGTSIGFNTSSPAVGFHSNVDVFRITSPSSSTYRGIEFSPNLTVAFGEIPAGCLIKSINSTSGEGLSLFPGVGSGVKLGAYAFDTNAGLIYSVWETQNINRAPELLLVKTTGKVGIGTGAIAPRALLDVNGKVIIGTNTQTTGSHTNAMLTVDGKIVAKELVITINNWADYVFENEYKLPNLYDIEKYYLANKHLPEIPSEKEVIENGVDLGEMNKLLLKKVEEMTILMVKQQKDIDDLKSKIK